MLSNTCNLNSEVDLGQGIFTPYLLLRVSTLLFAVKTEKRLKLSQNL